MSFELETDKVADLIRFVDQHVRECGCDHTRRFSAEWASHSDVDWDDLQDALDGAGAFCDCEVVLNIEDGALKHDESPVIADRGNPWLLPPNFVSSPETVITKILVSRPALTRSAYTKDGEWLVPAPADAKPRKRVRKLVHFFIGMETGLPSEVGFVADVDPIQVSRYAHAVASSSVPELARFDRLVASFVFAKIAKFPIGTPVGIDISDRIGVASKHRELNVHRVYLRK
jgi:Protein of unknown function (DUF2695)